MKEARPTRIEHACRALMLAVALTAGAGCLAQHEKPSASDTATNWLRSCVSDGVCGGGSCIEHVCTTICSARGGNACQALDESARCEPRLTSPPVCDLPCSSSAVCEAFRADYTCQLGHCRAAPSPPGPASDSGAPPDDPRTEPSTSSDADSVTPPPSGASAPRGTLISSLADNVAGFIPTPHKIQVLNANTGAAFVPPLQVESASDGSFSLPVLPAPETRITLLVAGSGSANDPTSTFDALKLDFDASKDPLLHISSVGTASVGQATGGYVARSDRAELLVTIYSTSAEGQRLGKVGCAEAFLDGDPGAAAEADLRYVAANGLPTTLTQQSVTLRKVGRVQFGNLAKGDHTLRISVDGGSTFIAEMPFNLPLARSEATSAYKAVHAELDVDVVGGDPTPAACPQ